MNLLMGVNNLDINKLPTNKEKFLILKFLSQILPPISLKYKTKKFKDDDDYKTSNAVLEIKNGKLYSRSN